MSSQRFQKDFEQVLPEFLRRAQELLPLMVAQESRRDVQILLMHELDASKQAAAGIGKIPIDFLCGEGRAHLLGNGAQWQSIMPPPESQPDGTTLYVSRDSGEFF